MAESRLCSVEGCGNTHYAHGMCIRHHARWQRHGDPSAGRTRPGEVTAFVAQVAIPFEGERCLEWPFAVGGARYPSGKLDGRQRLVHRYICEKVHGMPEWPGLHAAHACGNRKCVNPKHLSWKTPLENEADKRIHGTLMVGSRNHKTKLIDDEVIAIRVLRGRLPTRTIAKLFNVSETAVTTIQTGRARALVR